MFTGLTEAVCQIALEIIRPTIDGLMNRGIVKRSQGYMVVLDPKKPWEPKYTEVGSRTDSPFHQDVVLFEESWDDGRSFDGPYGAVALQKAFASWKTGLSAQDIQQRTPYLYQRGWTKWGGSTVGEGGLVVAFSGVEPWFDQMICEMMLAAIKGVCLDEMHHENGVMNNPEITFLGIKSSQPLCYGCGVEMVKTVDRFACPSCGAIV